MFVDDPSRGSRISLFAAVLLSIAATAGSAGADLFGPDAAGTMAIDSGHPGGPMFSWVDAAAAGTPLGLGDDVDDNEADADADGYPLCEDDCDDAYLQDLMAC